MPGIIEDAAAKYGLDPEMLSQIARIESSGNPNARTGSYKGLFQLSDQEFAKHGGGDIFNATDNANAAAAKIAAETAALRQSLGRDPTGAEIYMVHQQGAGGFAAHSANPDAPAWRNMHSTGEGRQKGEGWARQAIWGNIPDQYKRQFGSVDNVTSQQFLNMWRNRFEGTNAPLTIGQQAVRPQQPMMNAAALGAQSTPVGVPLFSSQQQPQGNSAQLAGLGIEMMQGPQMQPVQFAPMKLPQQIPLMELLKRGGFGR